jgi:glucose-1-phosphate thymidylyltransferase
MDRKKIGQNIVYLRNRMGYTQQDLADRIGISDKAVSKWERGISVPDIACLSKLAILLDTDTDSLLTGSTSHNGEGWCGVLILSENKQGITADSMVYSKPLVYFLLSYFLLVGIKKIYISCTDADRKLIEKEFDDGQSLGLSLLYCNTKFNDLIKLLDADIQCRNLMIVSERILLYGVDQTRFFYKAMNKKDRITIMSLPKKYDSSVSSITFDSARRLVPSYSDEKIHTQYDYYEIPVIFCPKSKALVVFKKADDGSLSVHFKSDNQEQLYTEVLDRGFVEMQIDTVDQLLAVSEFVKLVQNACGMEIYCIEEIAWRRGMITLDQMVDSGLKKAGTSYGQYILSLAERYKGKGD